MDRCRSHLTPLTLSQGGHTTPRGSKIKRLVNNKMKQKAKITNDSFTLIMSIIASFTYKLAPCACSAHCKQANSPEFF